MTIDELVDAVKARVSGTRSDPLTREEVEKVVRATLDVLGLKEPPEGIANAAR